MPPTNPQPRRMQPALTNDAKYKQHEGAVVFTHINDAILDHVSQLPIPKLGKFETIPNPHSQEVIPPSAFALYAVGRVLNRPFRDFNDDMRAVSELCVLDRDTKAKMRTHTNGDGISDLDFTGHFAPALAADMVGFFHQEGVLSQEEYENFTLTDYAHVINTGWFSNAVHNLARTRNGIYGRFGDGAMGYKPGAFHRHMQNSLLSLPKGYEIFTHALLSEPEDGHTYHAVELTASFIRKLRQEAKRGAMIYSLGCPVARHNVTLDDDLVNKNPPVRELLRNRTLQPSGKQLSSESTRTHFELEYSTIDNALILLSQRLIAYETAYGTPVIGRSRLRGKTIWKHRHKEAVDALRYPTEKPLP